ncbi:HIT family protein [Bradyrhizobium commune]|uniref:HIT domain-containing protein n=1 Tax=Bradyrhizobium commune TaxID=83627 RepID=A0A7S9D406_9BRAD|nr:HIT domain-containing protein [Bradyrhizobium commune]QPF90791.1 HIT domain-containing protein [Bradyrhizobium commune]
MSETVISIKDALNRVDRADERHFVAELNTGYLTLSKNRQYFRGYCFFTCKLPAQELHELPNDFAARHLVEMSIVAEAVQSSFNAKKMNVAFFGNSWKHVHWNIIPRYGTDPLPEDAIWSIDREIVESVHPTDEDLLSIRDQLRSGLKNIADRHGIDFSFEHEAGRSS